MFKVQKYTKNGKVAEGLVWQHLCLLSGCICLIWINFSGYPFILIFILIICIVCCNAVICIVFFLFVKAEQFCPSVT